MIPDWELFFIALIALLLFGNKLPLMMRKLGRNLAEFKRAMEQTREQVRKSVEESDKARSKPAEPGQTSEVLETSEVPTSQEPTHPQAG